MGRNAFREVNIGVLVYRDAMMSAVYGMGELIQVAERLRCRHPEVGWPSLQLSYWASPSFPQVGVPEARVIALEESVGLEVIIVPPSISDRAPVLEDLRVSDWLWALHQRGCILASACAGAFLLAEAGVLNGRPTTTHWILAEEIKARYPEIDLQPGKILVDDDDIITAGGLMAWMDLGIRIVQRFTSPTLVMELSKYFIVDTGAREQRFYESFYPRLNHGDERILKLQHWLQRHYAEQLSLADLASQTNLSERSLQRRLPKPRVLNPPSTCRRCVFRKRGSCSKQPVWASIRSFGGWVTKITALSADGSRRR